MKTRSLLTLVIAIFSALTAFTQVTVSGYANLENRTNHANIKVVFLPISPSAVRDSAYTNAVGYYEKEINEGVYTIQYEKEGFQSFPIHESHSITSNFDAGEGTLLEIGTLINTSNVSGIWDGIYTIQSNVVVNVGDTLRILPGSIIRFLTNSTFQVNGTLIAEGSQTDTIEFYSMPANQRYARGQWAGMLVSGAAVCVLDYMKFRYAVIGVNLSSANASFSNITISECSQDALYLASSTLTLENSNLFNITNRGVYLTSNSNLIFRNSEARFSSYGIYANQSGVEIEGSSFRNNSYGVNFYGTSNHVIKVKNSNFEFNSTDGIYVYSADNVDISNVVSSQNGRYGIFVEGYATVGIKGSLVEHNTDIGIRIGYNSNVNVQENIIANNNSHGIYLGSSSLNVTVRKNILAYNTYDGIAVWNSGITAQIINNTFYSNRYGVNTNYSSTETIINNIFVSNTYGINNGSVIEVLEHNSFFENTSGSILNLSNTPTDAWVFVSQNANGDSADIYLNIYEAPLFNLTSEYDFSLNQFSANIDAGKISMLDPDGTASDIGAVYFDKGNPHTLYAIDFNNQSVSLSWDMPLNDSLVSMNVYYKESGQSSFALFENTNDTSTTVSGLINGVNYDFAVTGVYANYESRYSPIVTEMPGVPDYAFDPVALNVTIPAELDTLIDTLRITNTGSRDLELDFGMVDAGTMYSAFFDGSGDYISVSDQANTLDGMDELTVEMWINKTDNNTRELVSKHYYSYVFYMYQGRLGLYKSSSTSYTNYTTSPIVPNGWHHVAFTWKGSTLIFYVDGVPIETRTNVSTTPIHDRNDNLTIGYGNAYGTYFNSNIADVKIWNIVRSEEEVAKDMFQRPLNNANNLVGYWPLSQNAIDYSSSGNNGSLVGNTFFDTSRSRPSNLIISPSSFNILPGETVEAIIKLPNISQGTFASTYPYRTNVKPHLAGEYEVTIHYGIPIETTPVYFSPVEPTGLPYTIVVSNSEIDNVRLDIGDEIGVFDGNLCVGAGVFDGEFNFVVTAWEGDPGNNLDGFVSGNDIIFKIYDTSADREAETDANFITGDGKFGYGQFSNVELLSTVYTVQEVNVTGGQFNLISFNLLPRYSAAPLVFGGIEDLQIVYDDKGGAYIPEYNINTLGEVDFRKGYHIFAPNNATISLEGTPITPNEWNITVKAGKWNSISYTSTLSADITTAIPASLHDSIEIVQTATGLAWIPELGVNTIGTLEPGMGYQIALKSNSDITFAYDLLKRGSGNTSEQPKSEFFEFVETGLNYTVVVHVESIPNAVVGDEIGVYDGDLCVGAGVITESSLLAISVWQASPENELVGFTSGNAITLKHYKAESAEVGTVQIQEPKFFGSGYYAELKSENVPLEILHSNSTDFSVYPSLFSDFVTIEFENSNQLQSIVVTNQSGVEVAELTPAKVVKWKPNGCATGLYYITVFSSSGTAVKKVVFIK